MKKFLLLLHINFFFPQPNLFFKKIKDSIFPLLYLDKKNIPFVFSENSLIISLTNYQKIISQDELYKLHQQIITLKGTEKIEFLRTFLFGSTCSNKKNNENINSKPSEKNVILIDPGHTACNYREALIEKKFLCIHPNDPLLKNSDTIKFYEAFYTGLTAEILGNILAENGFIVKYTRPPKGGSSFGVCYEEFFRNRSKMEKMFKDIFQHSPNKTYNLNPNDYFNKIFRNADLKQRKKIILETNPDLLVCIHYNVEATNKPWNRSVRHNYSMVFVPGSYDSISPTDTAKILNFLCLLIDDILIQSIKLSGIWINKIKEKMNVSPALPHQAPYLSTKCKYTGNPGVFTRDLALLNTTPCLAMYGEAFLMDSSDEIRNSIQHTSYKNKSIPIRIYLSALSYAETIMEYFNNK